MKKLYISKLINLCLAFVIAFSMLSLGMINSYAVTPEEAAIEKIFDANYYAANNPDVVSTVGNSKSALMKHYIRNGIYEGRSASASFNATSYKNRYSDLSSAYGDDMIKYVKHYVSCGEAEGRNATPKNNVAVEPIKGNQFLGSYTTKYKVNEDRATNVSLAASLINGVVVAPGAEFSFTNTVGPRTPERGFVEATVYINKEHARGIGGGICQVSSTLYAAMKTIGIPATERHPHSLPVSYLPEGWDATISGTTLDLRFVNIYDRPLLITASADDGRLTVSLYLKK